MGKRLGEIFIILEIATNTLTRFAKQGLSCVITRKCNGNAAFAFVYDNWGSEILRVKWWNATGFCERVPSGGLCRRILTHFFPVGNKSWFFISTYLNSAFRVSVCSDVGLSQKPQGLRRGSVAFRLQGFRVRIRPGSWISISCLVLFAIW